MKIQHLSFSSSGGAGNAARILAEYQRKRNNEVELSIITDSNIASHPLANIGLTARASMDNFAIKDRGFKAPISLLRDLSRGKKLAIDGQADVVHMHWINGVLPNLSELSPFSASSKFFWTLHDMNPGVGVCHYSMGCMKFLSGCTGCPAVKPIFQPMVAGNFERKMGYQDLLKQLFGKLTFISPSKWLADSVSTSPLMADSNIRILSQPIDEFFFEEEPPLRNISGEEPRGLRVGVVASNLLDPIKGVDSLIRIFKDVREDRDSLFLVGSGGNYWASKYQWIESLGSLQTKELATFLGTLDALIVYSEYDNAPLVLAESHAVGTPVIGKKIGGIPEMIEEGLTGWIVETERQVGIVLDTLRRLSEGERSRISKACRIQAKDRNHPSVVASMHLDLYYEVI